MLGLVVLAAAAAVRASGQAMGDGISKYTLPRSTIGNLCWWPEGETREKDSTSSLRWVVSTTLMFCEIGPP